MVVASADFSDISILVLAGCGGITLAINEHFTATEPKSRLSNDDLRHAIAQKSGIVLRFDDGLIWFIVADFHGCISFMKIWGF